MKKFIAAAFGMGLLMPMAASADIKVNLPANSGLDSLNYNYTSIIKLATAPRGERGTIEASVPVVNNVAVIPVGEVEGGWQFNISLGDKKRFSVYAATGDQIISEVSSLEPLKVRSSGSPTTDGINEIDDMLLPMMEKYIALRQQENPPREQLKEISEDINQTLKDYITENPTNPNSVYALMDLDGEDFLEYFPRISEGAKTSLLFPLAESQKSYNEKRVEKERRQKEMAKGDVTAPNFTLLNLEGKEVSLSDFRGKWVILDFWGSWCIWCIKGFPELKEAFEKYKDVMEIVGVDCNE
ncbi:MAG: redoxin domain-containing protein, partial [Muribaculaceae bacterium]|nr:redoxin domain-containing protein [Muribaculaceae bacterium]